MPGPAYQNIRPSSTSFTVIFPFRAAKEPVPAAIILPDGSWAASSTENPGYAAATVVLNRSYQTYWLSVGPCRGEGRNLYFAERRLSVYEKNLNSRKD